MARPLVASARRTYGQLRYLLMSCLDRNAEPDDVEEQLRGDIEAWKDVSLGADYPEFQTTTAR